MKLAPLFNYRKRQRQAVVSDPQQHSGKDPVSDSSLSHPSGSNSNFIPNISDFQIQQSCSTGHPRNLVNRSNIHISNTVSSTRQGIREESHGINLQEQAMKPKMHDRFGKGQDTNHSVSSTKATGGSNFVSSRSGFSSVNSAVGRDRAPNRNIASTVNQSGVVSNSSSSSSRVFSGFQNDSKTTNNVNPGSNLSVSSNFHNRGGFMTTKSRGGTPQVRSDNSARSPRNSVASSHLPVGRGKISANSTRQEAIFDDADDSWIDQIPHDLGKAVPAGKGGKAATDRSSKTATISPASDQSIRVFTCPISTIRAWVASKLSPGIIMFEVYGVVDSATVRDKSGTGKEFVLRDDTGSISCIFYEIDRELPRLTRGQVHRVVGLADSRRDLLKVVSVRVAEKTERSICQMASQLSQQEMEALTKSSHEP